jgi:hypothetical protein
MLASGKIVGFVPTKDYDKARAFYEGNLGFEFISLDQYALVMSVGGHKIRIAKVPNFTPLQGTILGCTAIRVNPWGIQNHRICVSNILSRQQYGPC